MVYVLDDKGQKVVRALENPKYVWRTIEGISEEIGVAPNQVAQILAFLPKVVDVVESSVPDKKGRRLFTTREHYIKKQNLANRILSVFSDRIK